VIATSRDHIRGSAVTAPVPGRQRQPDQGLHRRIGAQQRIATPDKISDPGKAGQPRLNDKLRDLDPQISTITPRRA